MKRIKAFLMILIVLLLSGCVKYDLTMGVNTDKSITITLISAVQKDYYTDDNGETKSSYEQQGFNVTQYEDDTYKGYKLSRKYESIDDISSGNCSQVEITGLLSMDLDNLILFKSNKNNTITTYTADFTYNLTVEEPENAEVDYNEYTETMSFKYTITLPTNSKIISENADEKTNNGYTLTWDIKYGELKNIDFVFSIDDSVVTSPVVKEEDNETIVDEGEKITTEESEEIETETQETTPQEQNNETTSFKDIILTIVLIIIIIGLFYAKIKTRKGITIKKSQRYHSTPRKK